MNDTPLTCPFCGTTAPDSESAADRGWEPSWWAVDPRTGREQRFDVPCCAGCAARALDPDGRGDGDTLKPGTPLPHGLSFQDDAGDECVVVLADGR